jgi:hypothetical protein
MNENTKTVSFLLAAAALAAAAWFTIPRQTTTGESKVVGAKLFPEFTDPAAVDSLVVQQFDQKSGKPVDLEVARIDSLWVLPRHGKYPADAKEHLAVAANSLSDLKILGMAPGFSPGSPPLSDEAKRGDYNTYGVVDPDPDTVKSTDNGVGTRISMKDAAGHELAAAIIGKAVPEQSNQCYVRKAGKEPVYIVQLDPSKLSVKFADWIEPNLLSLNSMDLKQVRINNYSIEQMLDPRNHEPVLGRSPNGEFALDLPSGDQPWKLVDEQEYDRTSHKMVPRKLAADEELNTANLDALKAAVEDLKIVDVERKPAQVPANLQVGKLDENTLETLAMRGFFVAGDPNDPKSPREIYSKSGEIKLQLGDGACYVLRFGLTKGESSAAEAAKRNKAEVTAESSPGMDRYLFVMAEFNQDAIAKPAKEQLPPEEKPAAKAEDKKAEDKKAEDKKAAEAKKPADVKKDEAKKPEEVKKPGEPKPEENKKAEAKKPDAAKAEAKKDEPKKADAAEAAEKARLRQAEQERIEKDYKRHMDEYNDKVIAGKKHVEDLNKRFAQWYYVIPGDVYEKIHLDRKTIVKKKEPPKDAHDHDKDATLPVGPGGALNKLPEVEKK